jgi:YggT family protein
MYVQESTILMKVALVLAQVLTFYNLLIWIKIIMSWFSPFSNLNRSPVVQFLNKIVDPYLNLFRNAKALKTQTIDFTPLLAFALISILQSILNLYGTTGSITLNVVLALIISTLWSYLISPFFIILIALIGVRLFLCFKRGPNSITLIRSIERIIGGFLNWIQKVFFFSKIVSDRTLLIASTIFSIFSYIVVKQFITYLISYLVNL